MKDSLIDTGSGQPSNAISVLRRNMRSKTELNAFIDAALEDEADPAELVGRKGIRDEDIAAKIAEFLLGRYAFSKRALLGMRDDTAPGDPMPGAVVARLKGCKYWSAPVRLEGFNEQTLAALLCQHFDRKTLCAKLPDLLEGEHIGGNMDRLKDRVVLNSQLEWAEEIDNTAVRIENQTHSARLRGPTANITPRRMRDLKMGLGWEPAFRFAESLDGFLHIGTENHRRIVGELCEKIHARYIADKVEELRKLSPQCMEEELHASAEHICAVEYMEVRRMYAAKAYDDDPAQLTRTYALLSPQAEEDFEVAFEAFNHERVSLKASARSVRWYSERLRVGRGAEPYARLVDAIVAVRDEQVHAKEKILMGDGMEKEQAVLQARQEVGASYLYINNLPSRSVYKIFPPAFDALDKKLAQLFPERWPPLLWSEPERGGRAH